MAELYSVRGAVVAPNPSRPEITLGTDRLTLAKRLWRGRAEDGQEFGFELESPLKDGDTVWETEQNRYVVRQAAEPVLEIALSAVPASAAAAIGWAIGNLHRELAAEPGRLLAADDTSVRRLLDRLNVSYQSTLAVFRPGRFARGNQASQDLGPSHRH